MITWPSVSVPNCKTVFMLDVRNFRTSNNLMKSKTSSDFCKNFAKSFVFFNNKVIAVVAAVCQGPFKVQDGSWWGAVPHVLPWQGIHFYMHRSLLHLLLLFLFPLQGLLLLWLGEIIRRSKDSICLWRPQCWCKKSFKPLYTGFINNSLPWP